MGITEVSIIHHVGIVLLLLWLLSSFNCCYPVVYFLSLVYLYLVHERYVMRLRRNVQFEERRQANQRRVLSDSETVRWLNHAIEKIWPVCMEHIVSQKILLAIIPWFLQKFKPWTVKDAVVHHLYLGRSPPMFTEMRVIRQSTNDDHLVLELGMNFRTADDMSAILAVKLTKRLGFGMWAKLHLMGMHVEGKVLIGVKFLHRWPFLGRLRVCFVEPPYFQMIVKPLIARGLDVTELPGIAGWLDKLLALAFEQTLVEPNMLVVDVEKFASPQPESWFFVDTKEPIAYAIVEVVEAADMKPSDQNGLADPYVKGKLGTYRFRTKTQRKTLSPKWHEEFKIPIFTWESPNVLTIEARDKDHFVDDMLGDCSISIRDLRDGQRHDMWLSLQNIKMGRLHIVVTVVEDNKEGTERPFDGETLNNEYKRNSFPKNTAQRGSFSSRQSEVTPKVADEFEPIDIEGQRETGIWIHHPGTEVAQVWEPRKGKSRLLNSQIRGVRGNSLGSFMSSVSGPFHNDSISTEESLEGNKSPPTNPVRRGLQKISLLLHRSPSVEDKSSRNEDPDPSPHANLMAVNAKRIRVQLVVEKHLSFMSSVKTSEVEGRESPEGSGPESPSKGSVKDRAKSILKHAGNSSRGIKLALTRKGLIKSKGQLGSVQTEREISGGSNSSDDESLPSAVYNVQVEAHSFISNPISGYGSDSLKSEENVLQTRSNDSAMDTVDQIDKVSDQGSERVCVVPSGSYKRNGVGLVEE